MTRNPNLWHWYHYDYIGNVAATTNQLGNQEDFFHFTYDQDSFGNVYGISNPILGYVYGSENGLAINPLYQKGYHQTTKEYDNRANMYFFNFRWYDPIIGRFISHEPLGIDGTNLYHFTFNNPVNLFDPNGLQVPLYPGWNPPTPTPRPPHPRPVTEFELLHYNMMNHINSAGLSTLSFFDSIYNFPRNYGAFVADYYHNNPVSLSNISEYGVAYHGGCEELTIFFSTLGAIDSVIPVFGGVVSRIEGIIWIAALFEDAATPSYYPIQPIQPFGNTLWEGIIDHSGGAWNPDEIIEMIDLYYMR